MRNFEPGYLCKPRDPVRPGTQRGLQKPAAYISVCRCVTGRLRRNTACSQSTTHTRSRLWGSPPFRADRFWGKAQAMAQSGVALALRKQRLVSAFQFFPFLHCLFPAEGGNEGLRETTLKKCKSNSRSVRCAVCKGRSSRLGAGWGSNPASAPQWLWVTLAQ